jgi:FkbM family methyltransferase
MSGIDSALSGKRARWIGRLPGFRSRPRTRQVGKEPLAVTLADDIVLCRILGRYKFFADARDWSISPHIIADGLWEPEVTQAIVDRLRPGEVSIDAGANLGFFSIVMASIVGPNGTVLSFEPNPRCADMLEASLALNGFADRVTVCRDPLGETDGLFVNLMVPANHPGGAQITDVRLPGSSSFAATTRRLDSFQEAGKCSLIKIDTEGQEEAIWRGMNAMIAGDRLRFVFIEFTKASYCDPARLLDEAEGAGFSLNRIESRIGVVQTTKDAVLAGPELQMLLLER